MNDKELLELAAKAAGINPDSWEHCDWNPLTDDGDALRLAVKLDMNIYTGFSKMIAELPSDGDQPSIQAGEFKSDDPYAATRRAIVRAAAELGRGKDD